MLNQIIIFMNLKRASIFGVIIWLLFTLFRIGFFPLKGRYNPIISALDLIVIVFLVFLSYYFYNVNENESGKEGILWGAIIIALDLVLFRTLLKVQVLSYFYEYGLKLILVPIITLSVNSICRRCKK